MEKKRENEINEIMEQPEKEHLEESDLILQLNLPSDEGRSYFVIENMEKPELVAEMRYYHESYKKSRETSIDRFLQAKGARLIPWYDTAGFMVEHPVNFYDIVYDYENGVSDASQLSTMEQAELLINRAEYGEIIFSEKDRELIMNYAYKFDDIKDTKALIWELKEAMEALDRGEYQEVRENALAEIASLPDASIGLSEMHQAGYYDAAILPINMGRAIELHQAGENIYSLHTDGSRTIMNTEQDILEDGGLFGIDAREWERYRVIESVSKDTETKVSERTSGLEVDGHTGSWHIKETRAYGGESFYLMESDEYTDSVAGIIVNAEGTLVAEDLWNGFDGGALEAIREYLTVAADMEKEQETETIMPFIARYYVLNKADGLKVEQEYQYFADLDSAITAYAKIPNHLDKELGIENREQPSSRVSLLICRNGMDAVVDIGEASRDGKWREPEYRDAVRRTKFYLDNHDQEIAYQVKDKHIIIQTVSRGYDYTIYNEDLLEQDGGVYTNPDLSIKEALEDILDHYMEATFEDCRVVDLEELQSAVERAEAFPLRAYTALKDLVNSGKDEIAFICGYGYVYVQKIPEGYNYIDYGSDFHEVTGYIYENPEATMEEAVGWVLKDEQLFELVCEPFDVEELKELSLLKEKERLKEGKFTPTSECSRAEEALGWLSRGEIEEGVYYYGIEKLEERGLIDEVKILGARVYGSRTREGLYREDSDVDVVLLYTGNIREDVFFNAINDNGLNAAGLHLDIKPIMTDKDASLEEFMENAEKYLDVKELQKLASDIEQFSLHYDQKRYVDDQNREGHRTKIYSGLESGEMDHIRDWMETIVADNKDDFPDVVEDAKKLLERIGQIQEKNRAEMVNEPEIVDEKISFYVAECLEYPVLGEYHDNLTLQEAVELYEKIPVERINGIKGIGIRLEDGSKYDGDHVLLKADVLSKDMLGLPRYKESPLVQQAVADLENLLSQYKQKEQVPLRTERESVLETMRECRAKLKRQAQKDKAQKAQKRKKVEKEL
ncbi:hypothetical protein NXH76_21735 [Blautia schinkii]|nr:hypothetical protein [Blautia schinkii]